MVSQTLPSSIQSIPRVGCSEAIKFMNINEIFPYEKNAKKHPLKQVQQVANSIKEFGFNQPIVVDKQGVIIVGHGRYEAAKLLKMGEVPVVVVDLTSEQAAAYRLADNKLNESEWDMALVIEELKGLDQSLIDLTGFDRALVMDSDDRDDNVPDLLPDAVSKLGDLYQLGKHRVLCGDATQEDDHGKLMGFGDYIAKMVFCDPPYNIGYIGNKGHKRREILNDKMKTSDFYKFLKSSIDCMGQYLHGAYYICMSSSELHTLRMAFDDSGAHWQGYIVWAKNNFTLSGSDYQHQHEPILYGLTPEEAMKLDAADTDGEIILYGYSEHDWYGGRKQGNVWQFDKPLKSAEHPTMKPVMLVAKAIKNSSEIGDIVLDPFLGSGSTLIAAHKLGRVCYGMELDPHYMDVIVQRYCEYVGDYNIIKNGEPIVWNRT